MTATLPDNYWVDLGRRAAACSHWRWLPGMLGQRIGDFDRLWARVLYAGVFGVRSERTEETCQWVPTVDHTSFSISYIPDFRDPATLGCLLALVRERCGATAHTMAGLDYRAEVGWVVDRDGLPSPGLNEWKCTEAEALVCALEVAP